MCGTWHIVNITSLQIPVTMTRLCIWASPNGGSLSRLCWTGLESSVLEVDRFTSSCSPSLWVDVPLATGGFGNRLFSGLLCLLVIRMLSSSRHLLPVTCPMSPTNLVSFSHFGDDEPSGVGPCIFICGTFRLALSLCVVGVVTCWEFSCWTPASFCVFGDEGTPLLGAALPDRPTVASRCTIRLSGFTILKDGAEARACCLYNL